MRQPVPYPRYEELLREHLPFAGASPLDGSSRLTDLGLDSLGTVRLLGALEEAFEVEFPDESLSAETFDTVDSLWSTLAGVAGSAQPSPPGAQT